MNEEGILTALGYSVNDSTINQLRGILSKCDFEDNELEKIVMLNDKLRVYEGVAYIAMSNSNDYFKIKIVADDAKLEAVIKEEILAWSNKYKLNLEKVVGKETYYVTGRF